MTALPVNAIFNGLQPDGYWAGTPAVVIRLMQHPDTQPDQNESLDGSYPLPDWDFDQANEVSLSKVLSKSGKTSPHFAYVGAASLANLVCSYRERHVLIIGREPGSHDIASFTSLLLEAGRAVQIETNGQTSVAIDGAWITLRALPSLTPPVIPPDIAARADEVLACIRRRSDLDRMEQLFSHRKVPVWLKPSVSADSGIYPQCFAVATRHVGWRVHR